MRTCERLESHSSCLRAHCNHPSQLQSRSPGGTHVDSNGTALKILIVPYSPVAKDPDCKLPLLDKALCSDHWC